MPPYQHPNETPEYRKARAELLEGRGIDLLSPVWNYFDLTPDGRGDMLPSLEYPIKG